MNIAEAKKAVKELEQPILKYQILDILGALEKSVREKIIIIEEVLGEEK